MSSAKKRGVTQCSVSDGDNEEPPKKVIKFSKTFSGQEVHDIYLEQGKNATKAAAILTEKLFAGNSSSDESVMREKNDVKVKIRKKIYKFEQKYKTKHHRQLYAKDLEMMNNPLIQASDYNFFTDSTSVDQSEKKSDKEQDKQDMPEEEEEDNQEENLMQSEDAHKTDYNTEDDRISISGDELQEDDFFEESEADSEDEADRHESFQVGESSQNEESGQEDESGKEEDSTFTFQNMSEELENLSTSMDSNLMSSQAPIRTSSFNDASQQANLAATFTPIKKRGKNRGPYSKQPFVNMSARTQRDRIPVINKEVDEICNNHNIEVDQLCGLQLTKRYNAEEDKVKIGKQLLKGEKLSSEPPLKKLNVIDALYLIERNKITKAEYLRERRILRERKLVIYPSWHDILKAKKVMGIGKIGRIWKNGYRAEISQVLKYTLQEHLTVMKMQGKDIPSAISYGFNYGADGSGKHDQLQTRQGISTKEVFLGGLTITEIKDQDGRELWNETSKGHNSPYNFRPFLLIPHHEDAELCSLVFNKDTEENFPSVDSELRELQTRGLTLTVKDHGDVEANLTSAVCRLIDGKMIETLSGLGGAYCTMCTKSHEECEQIDLINLGIEMDRNIEDTIELANRLWDPMLNRGKGGIRKAIRDYHTRKGITEKPITTANVCRSMAVMHLKIKVIEWFATFMVRLNTVRRWQAPHDPQKFNKAEENEMIKEKKRLRKAILKEINIDIGKPDALPTGPMFYTFSSDASRRCLMNLLIDPETKNKLAESESEEDKKLCKAFEHIHASLCAIVRIINSQHRKIDVYMFKLLCNNCSIDIRRNFPWAKLNTSLHRALAHSWQRIEENGKKGLGNESEEVLESCNKLIRYYKKHGSRKMKVEQEFCDIFNHIWIASSPLLNALDPDKEQKKPKREDEKQVHDLIESMFLEEIRPEDDEESEENVQESVEEENTEIPI